MILLNLGSDFWFPVDSLSFILFDAPHLHRLFLHSNTYMCDFLFSVSTQQQLFSSDTTEMSQPCSCTLGLHKIAFRALQFLPWWFRKLLWLRLDTFVKAGWAATFMILEQWSDSKVWSGVRMWRDDHSLMGSIFWKPYACAIVYTPLVFRFRNDVLHHRTLSIPTNHDKTIRRSFKTIFSWEMGFYVSNVLSFQWVGLMHVGVPVCGCVWDSSFQWRSVK